jgi:hypothetical protein
MRMLRHSDAMQMLITSCLQNLNNIFAIGETPEIKYMLDDECMGWKGRGNPEYPERGKSPYFLCPIELICMRLIADLCGFCGDGCHTCPADFVFLLLG